MFCIEFVDGVKYCSFLIFTLLSVVFVFRFQNGFTCFAPLFAEHRSESILSFCQRLGHPIDPEGVHEHFEGGKSSVQKLANAMANTRDNRLSGKTTEDGALVSVPVSVGD